MLRFLVDLRGEEVDNKQMRDDLITSAQQADLLARTADLEPKFLGNVLQKLVQRLPDDQTILQAAHRGARDDGSGADVPHLRAVAVHPRRGEGLSAQG